MTMRHFIPAGIFASLLLLHIFSEARGQEPVRVKVAIPLENAGGINELTRRISLDNLRNDTAFIETDSDEAQHLLALFPGSVLGPAAVSAFSDSADMASSLEEARTFLKYPTFLQYVDMMKGFASTFPDLCLLDTIGFSRQGRPVLVLKLGDRVGEDEGEPRFMYSSTIHGDEILGYMLLLRLADTLLNSYGQSSYLTRLMNEVEIWINPLSNPDGAYRLSDTTLIYAQRYNSAYVDLNRNFPDPADDDAVDDRVGREQETVDMMDFLIEHRFNLSANLHSGAEVVNYPWDHTKTLHPDDDWLIFISREYADEAHAEEATYMDEFPDGITNGADWYVIYGGRQDYVTYYLGGRELTLELCNTKLLPSSQLDLFWRYNDLSLINLMQQARYGIHGDVADAAGQPLDSRIFVLYRDVDTIPMTQTVDGRFFRYLKEGSYDLVVFTDGYTTDTVRNVPVFDYMKTELRIRYDAGGSMLAEYALIQSDRSGIELPSDGGTTGLQLYPNPAEEQIFVDIPPGTGEMIHVAVFSVDGRILQNEQYRTGEGLISVRTSALPAGMYIIRMDDGIRKFSGRFVKH